MGDTRIEDAPQIAQFATPLKELGYRSLEQFLGTAAVEPDALAKYLKIDVNNLQTIVASIPRPAQLLARGATRRKHPVGVRLHRITHPSVSLMRAPGGAAALPPTVNLIAEMQPIRDQG